MAKGDIHTVPHSGTWANRVEGGKQVSNTARNKQEAQAKGREMARERGVEHQIHNRDGAIAERNGPYPPRRDPRRSKG